MSADKDEEVDDAANPANMARSFVAMLTGNPLPTTPSKASPTDGNKDQSTFEIKQQPLDSSATELAERLSKLGIEWTADYPCWLMKDVLLQGHLYLSDTHLTFFAFLPHSSSSKKPVMTGNLGIEGVSTLITRYYAVLQGNTLSIYNKSTDLYFPQLTIDLATVIKVEIIGESFVKTGTWIKITTENKSYKFQCDSRHAARSWLGQLRKCIFIARNKGDEVIIKFPLQNILEIEKTELLEGSDSLKIVVEEGEYGYDDYFFMLFDSGSAHQSIDAAVKRSRGKQSGEVLNSTFKDRPTSSDDCTPLLPLKKVFARSRTSTRTSSDLRGPKDKDVKEPIPEQTAQEDNSSEKQMSNGGHIPLPGGKKILNIINPVTPIKGLHKRLTSPNLSPQDQHEEITLEGLPSESLSDTELQSDETPMFFPLSKSPTSSTFSSITKLPKTVIKTATTHLWSSQPQHYTSLSIDNNLSPEEIEAANGRFQRYFSLPPDDTLVATYYCHLHHSLPVYGKAYLSEYHFCFRSLLPGTNTKLILPLKDIETVRKDTGILGYQGLTIVIRGYEELFLEFGWGSGRDDCEWLLLRGIEANNSGSSPKHEDAPRPSLDLEHAKIRLIEDQIFSESGLDVPVIIEHHPLVQTTVHPIGKHFVLLTIGSRGDVQPFIALGLGLVKEGHTVSIATHLEFKEWIESYDLGFREIAGNPTQLMALMVEHGSMNVGMIKDASSKFRSWINELLTTSWDAVQDGCDVLIEAPSALGGIHIAEKLKIPYFRAFTMPWTRTRAYPHSFIVPDQKKGGSYNYLTHVIFENVYWKGTASQVNKFRVETLGLPKTSLSALGTGKIPFLYNVSPCVMPPPVDFNNWVKVTGYWFLDEGDKPVNPDLVAFISKAKKDGKKLVYIGFGSIVVSNSKELTQAIVEAVLDSDVRCILNKGWSERLDDPSKGKVEVALPPEIFNAGSVPHDWLFPQLDAVVHHGGSGTTGAGLRAGLPTIIKPFFGDQFFYAIRIEDIGAGIGLKKLNKKSLSAALKEVTTNSRMITKAKNIGSRIREENGVKVAIDAIYRDFEYAKEVMRKKHEFKDEEDDMEKVKLVVNEAGGDFGRWLEDEWYMV